MAILHHHEKYNGQGYPSQIKSKKIPITSRIISICATYARRYLLNENIDDILAYINSESNISFDPELVKVFTKDIKKTHEI
jgi:HD-GYP domain-containing protein (c-di-GMP phosphodiesterase class II)